MSTGHIYRRPLKDGSLSRWRAVIDQPKQDGRRRQLTRSFDTRREAQAWLAEQVTARRDHGGAEPVTWGEYLPAWLVGKTSLKGSTRASYQAHIDRYLTPAFGDIPLERLSPQQVQQWQQRLLADGVSPATVRRVHATLSSAITTATRQDLIQRSPLRGVDLPAATSPVMRVWTPEQARKFLHHTSSDELAALWRLALVTGLRRGELLGLQRPDIDTGNATVQVRRNQVLVAGRTITGAPKSRASGRIIPVDAETNRLLKQHLARRQVVPLRPDDQGHQWVFADQAGEPIDPAWLSRRFHELCEAAGVAQIRFHDLRHTSATLGLQSGEDLKAISERLGHANISVTADLYVQVPLPAAWKHAEQVARLLGGHTGQQARLG